MANVVTEIVLCSERVQRYFYNYIRIAVRSYNIHDITPVQAMILYNVCDSAIRVGEIKRRGFYNGSNVSYNIKGLINSGYLDSVSDKVDKRMSIVRPTEKALQLRSIIEEEISKFKMRCKISDMDEILKGLERVEHALKHSSPLTNSIDDEDE